MDLFKELVNPDVIAVIARMGGIAAIMGYVIYRMAKKYDEIQEKRIAENKEMQKEYMDLARDVNKTLDILIRTIQQKKR